MHANPLRESVRVLGVYVRGQFLIFVWELVLYSVAFALTKVPLWGLMAFLCALLGWIPRIGSLIGIGLVLFVSLLGGADLLQLGIAAVAWALVQALEGFWLTPWLLGKPLGLTPMSVFLALIAGSFAFGPIGMLLAVPVLAVAMVWFRYFKEPNRRELPAPPPVPTYVQPTSGIDRGKDKSQAW